MSKSKIDLHYALRRYKPRSADVNIDLKRSDGMIEQVTVEQLKILIVENITVFRMPMIQKLPFLLFPTFDL